MFRDTHHGKPCKYCQRPMDRVDVRLHATRDHIIPRCRGGSKKGIVICCATCNGIKADMTPDEWQAYMIATPSWWLLSRAQRRTLNRKRRGLAPRNRGRRMIVVPANLIYTTASCQDAQPERKAK